MSFPRYPKYKASGVEWLGDIPEHWDVKPLRSVFKFSKGLTITKEDLRDEGVCCVNYGEIHSKYGFRLIPDIHPLRCVEPEYLTSNPDALIKDGDFVFADTSEDLEGSGNFTHLSSENPIFAGYHTIIGRPKKDIYSLLLAYQFHSSVFRSQIQRQVKGVKVFSISQGILKCAKCWLPPHDEQTAIAEFLDRETGKIDELVAEQRRLMELLKEKRQAVISHAITKGLNPHAPMKPSGIEWLGDVPDGWEVKPLRSVFTFSKGLTITKEDLQDEGVQCVNYGEIHSKYGFRLNPDIHPLRCVAPEYLLTNPDARIQDGDFVFADTSEDLEGSGNFTHLRSESPIFAGYHTIIARPRKDTWSLFLAYQFHSSVFRSQIQRQVKGVKVFSISQGILKAAKCWLPPIPEQKAIATFLDTELSKFDTLTVEAQRTIELLQERRTALISAAVTGQIDVRQPPKN